MAQSGYTPISIYYSATATNVPLAANLTSGELGINIADGKLYYKDNAGTVQVLASKAGNINVSSISFGTTGLTPSTTTTGAVTVAGTLVVSNGGTGQTTLATGSIGYGQGTSAHAALAIGTAGQVLTVNSGATAPQWVNASSIIGGAGGSNTQVQYNSSGALAGSANLTFNGTTLTSTGFAGPISGVVTSTSITDSGLTSGRVTYAGTAGLLQDSANLTFNGTTLTANTLNLTNALTTSYGGTGLTSFTAGDLPYYSTGTALSKLAIGTNGYILQSNGSAPTWVLASSVIGGAGGSNTQVQYNSSGLLAGSANLTFNGTTLTTANDASISGLTVGKGGGSVNSNTAVGGGGALALNTTGANNVAVGSGAGYASTTANNNISIGTNSGSTANTGSNVSVGVGANQSNTGGNNTAIGHNALIFNSTASNNTAVGYQAGYANTTGTIDAFGSSALGANTTGTRNAAFGIFALQSNTTGVSNTSMGRASLATNTTGNYNTAFGDAALNANTTASSCSAVGFQSGYNNTTGINNNFFGYQAGFSNTVGNANSFFGHVAGYFSTGSNNVGMGSQALGNSGAGNSNTAIGVTALQFTTGSNNTAVGYGSLVSNTTASNNTAVGYQAAYANTTGANINAFGYKALTANTTGGQNDAFSYSALASNTTGSQNAAFGFTSLLQNTTGSNNSAFGYQSLYSNTTASNSTAVGYQAGYSASAGCSNNTFIGYQAGYSSITSGSNQFFGYLAGRDVTTGYYHTIIGAYNGNQGGLDIRTANNYIVLSDGQGNPRGIFDGSGNFGIGTTSPGVKLDVTGTIRASQSLVFGSNGTTGAGSIYSDSNWGCLITAKQTSPALADFMWQSASSVERMRIDSNGQLLIGTTSTGSSIPNGFCFGVPGGASAINIGHPNATPSGYNYVTFAYNSSQIGSITQAGTTGVLYNVTSDYRLKNDVTPIQNALNIVEALNPVSFTWVDGRPDDGFIAHELQAVLPNCVTGEKDAVNEDGTPHYQQMDNSGVIPFLVKAIQELNAKVTALEAQLGAK